MIAPKRTIQILSAAVLALLVLPGCMPYSTGPTEVGVRTVKWSPLGNRGVEEKVYAPGSTYFFVPFLNDWHTFDTRLQNLEMTAVETRGDRRGRDDLMFKTIDGNDISLDVIISYRIDPEQAPYILQDVAADDEELKDNIVRTVARSKPRDIFGELKTEDFYTAQSRTEKSEEAVTVLNEILKDYGIIVERVGTRDYRFNPAYQEAIEEKKVADQQAEKYKSETLAAKEEYLMKVEEAKGDIEKIKAEADGEYERAVIEADAYYEQQASFAKAIEAEGLAEAEGIMKMNEALSGSGGAAMVKLKIAEALMNKRIILLPIGGGGLDVRSTDINSLLQLYGLQSITQKHVAPPQAPAAPQQPRSLQPPATPPQKPQLRGRK
jgi:regulator of protease activity HflC (stomatin/prohibitin superfamily)